MYINKKSLPKEYHSLVDFNQMEIDLKIEESKNADFEHFIKNNNHLIKLKLTYEVSKTKGMKWDVIKIDSIEI